MDLGSLNGITACETLQSLIEEDEFFKSATTKVFVDLPEKNLPDSFVAIFTNGGIVDRGDCCEGILMLSVCTKLIGSKKVNNAKIVKMLNRLDNILTQGGVRKGKFYFVVSNRYNMIDEMDYSLGYMVKSINLFYRKER